MLDKDAILELLIRVKSLEDRCGELEKQLGKPKRGKVPDSGTAQVRKAFVEGYQTKFGHEYHWGAKENGLAAQWLRSIPFERAIWLIKWYLDWTDTWITKQGHPFGLLVTNVVKLEAVLNRGGKYFKAIAKSVIDNEDIETQMEVEAYGKRREDRAGNSKIGFDNGGELQDEAPKAIPLKRDRAD